MVSRRAISLVGCGRSTYSRSQEIGPLSKLPREAEVVAPELTQVGELVAKHRDALEPPAEGEARVPLGVVADELEELRIDQAGATDLDPARVPAYRAAAAVADVAGDVRLDRRLREREVVRAQFPVLLAPPKSARRR